MSIFFNGSTHLSNKPECQQKGLNWSISFIPVPFIGYQDPGDLIIRVLSWSLFSERGAGELSAGNTRICRRVNKNNSRKAGRIQGGVEAGANLEGPLCPERPCMSGLFLMTLSWVGSPTTAPSTGFFFFLVFYLPLSESAESYFIRSEDNENICTLFYMILEGREPVQGCVTHFQRTGSHWL